MAEKKSIKRTHRLVRGIHVIPENVENAAGLHLVFYYWAAAKALERVLKQLSAGPVDRGGIALASRRLRVVQRYVDAAGDFAGGAFDVPLSVPAVKITWDHQACQFWAILDSLKKAEYKRQMALGSEEVAHG